MQFTTVLFLLIGSCLCLALAQVSSELCCVNYWKQLTKATQIQVVEYRWQVPNGGCNLAAVIFTMRSGREFCADPKEKWVSDLMEKIDAKRNKKRRQAGIHHGR